MRENYRLKSLSGEISFSLRVLASFPFGLRSSPLSRSRLVWVCVCVKEGKRKKGWKLFLLLLASARGWWKRSGRESTHTKATHNLRRPSEESYDVDRKQKTFSLLHDYKFIIIPYTFPTTTSSSSALGLLSAHTVLWYFSQGKLLNFKHLVFLGRFFCSNTFSPSQQNFPFSRLMIIKCTTSGSCQIISHLTPHAIGRKRKEK